MALRLSRFFEVGAYVAIAAALLVGIFLGLRLVRDGSGKAPVQTQVSPGSLEPPMQKPADTAQSAVTQTPSVAHALPGSLIHRRVTPAHEAGEIVASTKTANEGASTDADAGYTALMFCDPLSCAAETQVVRVELPAAAGAQSSQPQMADLVVGYDGVVRAMRIVN
jgi:hypothetical protein